MDENLSREILDRLIVIETKLDGYKEIMGKCDFAYNLSNRNAEDIKEMKENNKWLWRAAVGAIITGMIGLLVALVKIKIGV